MKVYIEKLKERESYINYEIAKLHTLIFVSLFFSFNPFRFHILKTENKCVAKKHSYIYSYTGPY